MISNNFILKITKKEKKNYKIIYLEDKLIEPSVEIVDGNINGLVIENTLNQVHNIPVDRESDNRQYFAILPITDNIIMKNIDPNKDSNWIYNISIISNHKNKITLFPFYEDSNLKYVTRIKEIVKHKWNITNNTIKHIHHVFTRNKIHLYMCILKNKTDTLHIPNSINSNTTNCCWNNYYIMIPYENKKPQKKPYTFKYPSETDNNIKLELKYDVYCDLEVIFNNIIRL